MSTSVSKWNPKTMKEYVKKEGYEIFVTSSSKIQDKVCFKCSDGHEYLSTFKLFNNGNRCPICWKNKRKNLTKKRNYVI